MAAARRLGSIAAHVAGGEAVPMPGNAEWSASGPYDEQLGAPQKTSALGSAAHCVCAGPYPVGVTSLQLDDHSRADPESAAGVRSLRTEIWYPAAEEARGLPPSKFSEFLLRGVAPGSIEGAESEAVSSAHSAVFR